MIMHAIRETKTLIRGDRGVWIAIAQAALYVLH